MAVHGRNAASRQDAPALLSAYYKSNILPVMQDVSMLQDRAGELDRLKARIEEKRDELVALTQDLIRIPTVNPPGESYLEICEYMRERLAGRGFEVELVRAHDAPGDSDRYPRWNLVARLEGRTKGECVHFNSHTDVVEAGSGWTVDPFGAEVTNGRIYGRGACDMKGGLAASVVAVEAFIETCAGFSGAIEISCTADEESGGYGGVAYLATNGYFSPRSGAARDHSRTSQQGPDLPWPPRCLVG